MFKEDILQALSSGKNIETIAKEFSDILNAVQKDQEQEKMRARKRTILTQFLTAITDYLVEFYPAEAGKFLEGTDTSCYTDEELDRVAAEIDTAITELIAYVKQVEKGFSLEFIHKPASAKKYDKPTNTGTADDVIKNWMAKHNL